MSMEQWVHSWKKENIRVHIRFSPFSYNEVLSIQTAAMVLSKSSDYTEHKENDTRNASCVAFNPEKNKNKQGTKTKQN